MAEQTDQKLTVGKFGDISDTSCKPSNVAAKLIPKAD